MTLILSGTNGLSDVDGDASTPAVRGTDANSGIFFGADVIGFSEGGTECARFNADAQFVAAAGTASLPVITTTGDTNTGIFFPAADTIAFAEGGAEAMRIDSSGRVGVGTTSPDAKIRADDTANQTILAGTNSNASFTAAGLFLQISRNTTNNSFFAIDYYNLGANAYKFRVADSGNVTNTNNSYGALSDVKLKQDIVDAGSQWDDIKNLRVRKFHWKSDPDGFLQMGLVAQEAELVSPGLIDEHPDYEQVEVPVLDDEGNPVLNEDGTPQVTKERNALGTATKAVKYSVLYMKAVKALQEAMERIETLEASNTALEARIAALETGA